MGRVQPACTTRWVEEGVAAHSSVILSRAASDRSIQGGGPRPATRSSNAASSSAVADVDDPTVSSLMDGLWTLLPSDSSLSHASRDVCAGQNLRWLPRLDSNQQLFGLPASGPPRSVRVPFTPTAEGCRPRKYLPVSGTAAQTAAQTAARCEGVRMPDDGRHPHWETDNAA
jgi:hypothetical protein